MGTNQETPEFDFFKHISSDSLNLCRKGLSDKDIPALIQFLQDNPNIKTVDLSLNNIGDQGIADFAERNHTVSIVNFTGNIISDHGLAVFAYKNQTITQVNFSQNPISDQGIDTFARINHTCFTGLFSKFRCH